MRASRVHMWCPDIEFEPVPPPEQQYSRTGGRIYFQPQPTCRFHTPTGEPVVQQRWTYWTPREQDFYATVRCITHDQPVTIHRQRAAYERRFNPVLYAFASQTMERIVLPEIDLRNGWNGVPVAPEGRMRFIWRMNRPPVRTLNHIWEEVG